MQPQIFSEERILLDGYLSEPEDINYIPVPMKLEKTDGMDFQLIAKSLERLIQREYPYLRPVFMTSLMGMRLPRNEIPHLLRKVDSDLMVNSYSYGIVNDDEAEWIYNYPLYEPGMLRVAYEITTPHHGRQLFFLDHNGRFWGIKGVGLTPSYRHQGDERATIKLGGAHNGLVELDKDKEQITMSETIRKNYSSDITGAIIFDMKLFELWDGTRQASISPAIGKKITEMESDWLKYRQYITELIYYGKDILRVADLDDTSYRGFMGYACQEEYLNMFISNLSFDYANKYMNHGVSHNNLNAQNVVVCGKIVDPDSIRRDAGTFDFQRLYDEVFPDLCKGLGIDYKVNEAKLSFENQLMQTLSEEGLRHMNEAIIWGVIHCYGNSIYTHSKVYRSESIFFPFVSDHALRLKETALDILTEEGLLFPYSGNLAIANMVEKQDYQGLFRMLSTKIM